MSAAGATGPVASPPTPTTTRRVLASRWVRLAAVAGATAAFVLLAPIAVAVVLLRCCDSARGASPGAWIVVAMLLLAAAALAAAFGAGAAAAIGWAVRRLSGARRAPGAGPPPT